MLENTITDISYLEATNTVTVHFQSGGHCNYSPITPETFAELKKSQSLQRTVQSFFRHKHIVGTVRNEG